MGKHRPVRRDEEEERNVRSYEERCIGRKAYEEM